MGEREAPVRRAVLIVLDSVGIGGAPDADRYGDEGSNTLLHVAQAVGGLALPNLAAMGLGRLLAVPGLSRPAALRGAFGRMQERSAGKDTMTGHWEIAGLCLAEPFPTYPQGFPPEVIRAFEEAVGRRVLGNVAASGTEIIERLGREHLSTGRPIVYTSVDSVFQIAAHEAVIPLEELYHMCQVARALLQPPHGVGRVIARPFRGRPGAFYRTGGRRDFSLPPPGPTLLDRVTAAGLPVWAVGKVEDIFAGRGVTEAYHTPDNDTTLDTTLRLLREKDRPGLLFANCVDFDTLYGHRNDPAGYAAALRRFDDRLPELWAALGPGDLLVLTADHGNDPTTPSTDHSREQVPLLVMGDGVAAGTDLGVRPTFADLGATLAELLGVERPPAGESFAAQLMGRG